MRYIIIVYAAFNVVAGTLVYLLSITHDNPAIPRLVCFYSISGTRRL